MLCRRHEASTSTNSKTSSCSKQPSERCDMYPYPRRRHIDIRPFGAESGPFEAKYGLPQGVHFCRRCVISNQRPNSAVEFAHRADSKKETIAFDGEGVCDACRLAEQKN